MEVDAIVDSSAGNPMQSFILQDQSGRYVACTALGRHAGSPAIADSNEAILYFAAARGGLKPNQDSCLWLYDEAHIVVLREKAYCPPKVTVMPM